MTACATLFRCVSHALRLWAHFGGEEYLWASVRVDLSYGGYEILKLLRPRSTRRRQPFSKQKVVRIYGNIKLGIGYSQLQAREVLLNKSGNSNYVERGSDKRQIGI